jgi:hypothetical protein
LPCQQLCTDLNQENQLWRSGLTLESFMRMFSLALLGASALVAVSAGGAVAMPFANPAAALESPVTSVRVVCDRFGRCYNTNRNARGYAPRANRNAYRYRNGYRNNYRPNRAYGYHRGPSVGIGVGPVGIGVRTW